eukprot:CAMPEP_0182876126 /NCGR_PEP_ID=MMETSP0034_2-20130328/13965_1 /TAXON_ID=156128 /ORGANISM="Nephroselmis pyriformis, Strain CCMP717" /LENGTH=179 /DNA_ID=CAMNT_0025008897 /DNA_START=48 /DNA_END=583 /DNA_ORIENTATION=+
MGKNPEHCSFCPVGGRGRPGYHQSPKWFAVAEDGMGGYLVGHAPVHISRNKDAGEPPHGTIRMCLKAYSRNNTLERKVGPGRRSTGGRCGAIEVPLAVDTRSARRQNEELVQELAVARRETDANNARAEAAEVDARAAREEMAAMREDHIKSNARTVAVFVAELRKKLVEAMPAGLPDP